MYTFGARRSVVDRCVAELNGTLTVDGESYQWNDDHGRYLDAGFSTAFSGNWSRLDDDCYTAQNKVFVGDGCLLPDDCLARHWVLDGDGCDSLHVPDVFFLSLILFLGTFGLAMFCRFFRSTGYFPSWVSDSDRNGQRPLPCVLYLTLCCFTCTIITRMWASAQRDGRPAEYRWRPLFNAAKFD